jgi:2-oxoglutarate ferredoxin oxidoreductase subunit delta
MPRGSRHESRSVLGKHPESIMKYWRKPLDIDKMKVPRGEVCIIVDRCKGCAFCVEYCPKDVLEMSEEFNIKGYHPPKVVKTGLCVNCKLCEMICPEFAIFSLQVEDEGSSNGNPKETIGAKEEASES